MLLKAITHNLFFFPSISCLPPCLHKAEVMQAVLDKVDSVSLGYVTLVHSFLI